MTLVQRVELTSSQASITLSNIPQDATDLYMLISARSSGTSPDLTMRFNGNSANYSDRYLSGNGTGASSGAGAYGADELFIGSSNNSNFTANTFSNMSVYIPNYSASVAKSISVDSVDETNATQAYQWIIAGLWNNTAAISSISLQMPSSQNFVSGSSVTLYKITKGSDGTTTVA